MKTTIRDIAVKSDVSIATVSRVLNNSGYVSEEVRKKVLDISKELNYQPNAIARSLKSNRTNTVGIVIPDISNPYFMKIAKGIEDIIHKEDYILIFASAGENKEKESEILNVLVGNRVDAVVIASSSSDDKLIRRIHQSGIPVLLMDRKLAKSNEAFDYVVEDNEQGAYELTKHLILEGHKTIGLVNGSLNVSTGLERYEGFKKAIKDYQYDEKNILQFDGNFLQKDGEEAVKYFFRNENKPTAILSFNNVMTYGVVLQLSRMGLSVPENITVASYGETEVDLLLKSPGIISVKQSPYEMGIRLGEILLERLNNSNKESIHEVFRPFYNFRSDNNEHYK